MSKVLIFLAPDGNVLLRNPAGADWFPGRSGEHGRWDMGESELPEGLREYIERIKRASAPLPSQTFQVEVLTGRDKPVQDFRATASSVFDENGAHLGYVITAEDMTEQLQLEEDAGGRGREILAMSEALGEEAHAMAQREKMVAIGTMAAGIAHEIGNPLASLSAVVQVLKRRHRGDEDSSQLHTLEEQIERIAKIVRQILEFSRPAATEWVLADLDELIEQTVTMVSYSRHARRGRIRSVPNRNLPRVRLMPQLFQQILVNLLLNALDAVEGLEGKHPITVERVLEKGWVKVVVKDRGSGMSEDQIRHAFEPFYTTKPPGKGTGLGLAVSYRLVERQGGRIKIDSTPGEGTVVTVSFKVDDPCADTVGSAGSDKPETTV